MLRIDWTLEIDIPCLGGIINSMADQDVTLILDHDEDLEQIEVAAHRDGRQVTLEICRHDIDPVAQSIWRAAMIAMKRDHKLAGKIAETAIEVDADTLLDAAESRYGALALAE